MANAKKRFPKIGDRVSALGQEGAYVVYAVNESVHAADLKQIGGDLRFATIPWDSLTFLDEWDASNKKR